MLKIWRKANDICHTNILKNAWTLHTECSGGSCLDEDIPGAFSAAALVAVAQVLAETEVEIFILPFNSQSEKKRQKELGYTKNWAMPRWRSEHWMPSVSVQLAAQLLLLLSVFGLKAAM